MLWHRLVFHATALLVVGFFVAFAAQRTTGGLATFGKLLSYWLYILAVLSIVLGAVFVHRHPGLGMMGHYPLPLDRPGEPAAPPALSQPPQQ